MSLFCDAMGKDLEREKDKVWRQATKAVGLSIPPDVKTLINEQVGPVSCPDDLEFYAEAVQHRLEIVKALAASSYLTEPREPRHSPERRYQRSLRRRLYLVQFVIGRQLASKKQRGRIRKSIKWKEVCRAWNEAHPNDSATPEHLRRSFYRAVADASVQQEYVQQMGLEIGEALAWDRLVSLVGSARSALDWAILLGANDVPLDKGFPSSEVQQMIKNNPDYARQAVNEFFAVNIMQAMVKRHLEAVHEMYDAPVDFEEGVIQ